MKVLFDDGQHYLGIIVRKDKEQDKWVTVFEDGTEDFSSDPATDEDYTFIE